MSLQVIRAQSGGSFFADSCLYKEDLEEKLPNSAEAKSLARSLEEGLLSRLTWTLSNLLLWENEFIVTVRRDFTLLFQVSDASRSLLVDHTK